MKHFLLKFNHGVEIGARLAYLGHHAVSKDPVILAIANEELEHRETLRFILACHFQKPSPLIDGIFTLIGKTIQTLCYVSPHFLLDFIARTMEAFAVFNYRRLAEMYPSFSDVLTQMADREDVHKAYFTKTKGDYLIYVNSRWIATVDTEGQAWDVIGKSEFGSLYVVTDRKGSIRQNFIPF